MTDHAAYGSRTRSGSTVTTKVNALHADGLGPVRAVTDAAGVVVERTNYRPYGEEVAQLQPLGLPETRGFIGERYDDTSGLQYLNARYYDPKLGMFIQPDWWEVMQAGVGTNRYSYSFNDPINGRDPSGHFALSEAELENLVARAMTAGSYGLRVAIGAAAGAIVGIVTPTELGDGTIPPDQWAQQGVALTEGMVKAGWTVNGKGQLVNPDGMLIRRMNGTFPRAQRFKKGLVDAGYATPNQKGHHIVELKDQNPSAIATREHLINAGIDPNSISNGLGLTNHTGKHSGFYSRKVAERLLGLTERSELLEELARIREELQKIDQEITEAKQEDTSDRRTATEEWASQQ